MLKFSFPSKNVYSRNPTEQIRPPSRRRLTTRLPGHSQNHRRRQPYWDRKRRRKYDDRPEVIYSGTGYRRTLPSTDGPADYGIGDYQDFKDSQDFLQQWHNSDYQKQLRQKTTAAVQPATAADRRWYAGDYQDEFRDIYDYVQSSHGTDSLDSRGQSRDFDYDYPN